MATNYNLKKTDTNIRIGECRFGYVNMLTPKANKAGEMKYSLQILIPKANTQAKQFIDEAIEAAKQKGVYTRWNGKMPVPAKLKLPLRDGDEEYPDDDTYKGMWFMNASSSEKNKPGVRVLENGQMYEALDTDDCYSGMWGAVTVNMYPFNNDGSTGIAVGVNNLLKTRDGDRLAGGTSADSDFADLTSGSCLD